MGEDWLAYFKAKRGMGAVICEGPEIEAACAEIEAFRARVVRLEDALKAILGWRELRDKIAFPVERVEDIARTALVGEEGR